MGTRTSWPGQVILRDSSTVPNFTTTVSVFGQGEFCLKSSGSISTIWLHLGQEAWVFPRYSMILVCIETSSDLRTPGEDLNETRSGGCLMHKPDTLPHLIYSSLKVTHR